MAEKSEISWTHATFNPWRGCTKVSDGCKFCYAETLSARNPGVLGQWGPKGERVIAAENYWKQPLKWDREAKAAGERRRVFCASLADVFEGKDTMPAESWPHVQNARVRLFETIDNTPNLDWLLLTKRPENVMHLCGSSSWAGLIPANVWIGTSVEDQATANERIPRLAEVPAAVRFLSCEPLLGAVDLKLSLGYIDWVIVGGESGPHARPMHPDWARSLRDQCQAAGVAFHFKQWGRNLPESQWDSFSTDINAQRCARNSYDLSERTIRSVRAHGERFYPMNKSEAGYLLDGEVWQQFPAQRAAGSLFAETTP